jgi:hypothetical protein
MEDLRWIHGNVRTETIMEHIFRRLRFTDKGCWEWQGTRLETGYGLARYQGKYQSVHRVVFRLMKGKIKSGNVILHSCDNPPCCNPDHLSQGSHQENMDDMVSKGRSPRPYGWKGLWIS